MDHSNVRSTYPYDDINVTSTDFFFQVSNLKSQPVCPAQPLSNTHLDAQREAITSNLAFFSGDRGKEVVKALSKCV